MKILLVTWRDHFSINGWQEKGIEKFVKDSDLCTSVGFLLKQNKRVLVLAQSLSSQAYGDILVIDKKTVVSVEQIGVMDFE